MKKREIILLRRGDSPPSPRDIKRLASTSSLQTCLQLPRRSLFTTRAAERTFFPCKMPRVRDLRYQVVLSGNFQEGSVQAAISEGYSTGILNYTVFTRETIHWHISVEFRTKCSAEIVKTKMKMKDVRDFIR